MKRRIAQKRASLSFELGVVVGVRFRAMGTRVIGITLLLPIGACAPSLRSKTAGSIGCPPNEVEIANEDSSLGWGSSARTWTASCRGKRFICSENTVTTYGKDATGISPGLACKEELDAGDQESSGSKSAENKPTPPSRPTSPPPKSVAGFDFGKEVAAIQQACEGAGRTRTSVSAKVGTCSGPAVDLGFEAEAQVTFCRDKSCALTLVHQPAANWIGTLRGLKQKLAEKYGVPVMNTEGIPDGCRQESQFVKCLEDATLRVNFKWDWGDGNRIEFTVGKPYDAEGPSAIRVTYVVPQSKFARTLMHFEPAQAVFAVVPK